MLKVGITGGIGCGKTYVAKIFEHLGVPIYYADSEAKNLYSVDSGLLRKVRKVFGSNVFEGDVLSKAKLAAVVFSNSDELAKLNSIVHPALQQHFISWCSKQAGSAYVMQEAAILFEAGFDQLVDKVLVVTAPHEMRIARVMSRDSVSKEQVLARMQNQLSQGDLLAKADFIIDTSGSNSLLCQVLEVHSKLLEMV